MRSKRGATAVEILVVFTAPAMLLGWTVQAVPTQSSAPLTPDWLLAMAADAVECAGAPRILVVEASSTSFGFEVACVPGNEAGSSTDHLAAFAPSAPAPPPAHPHAGNIDTVTFFFQPDSTTSRPDDFALMRRLNNEPPSVEHRNLLIYPGRSFLHYFYRYTDSNGTATSQIVPAEWLPLYHVAEPHGTAADTGVAARIDTLYAVEVNFSFFDRDSAVASFTDVIPLTSLQRDRLFVGENEPAFSHTSAMLSSCHDDSRQKLPMQVCI